MEAYLITFVSVLSAELLAEGARRIFEKKKQKKRAAEIMAMGRAEPEDIGLEDEAAAFDLLCAYDINAAYGKRKSGRQD